VELAKRLFLFFEVVESLFASRDIPTDPDDPADGAVAIGKASTGELVRDHMSVLGEQLGLNDRRAGFKHFLNPLADHVMI